MWGRNKLYSKLITMSDVIGLLAILLATQSSNGQVDRYPAVEVVDDESDQIPAMASQCLRGPWISELFYQALVNFTVRNIGSSACRAQSDMYDRHLRNNTSWAVRSEYSLQLYCTKYVQLPNTVIRIGTITTIIIDIVKKVKLKTHSTFYKNREKLIKVEKNCHFQFNC